MNTTNKIQMPVYDEEHWMKPGETKALEHKDVVSHSFASNHPLYVDYENGTITTFSAAGLKINGIGVVDGKDARQILVSYCYWTGGHSDVVNDDKTITPITDEKQRTMAEELRKTKAKEYREAYDKDVDDKQPTETMAHKSDEQLLSDILNPILGKTINEDEFMKVVEQIKKSSVSTMFPRIKENVEKKLSNHLVDEHLKTTSKKAIDLKPKAPKSIEPSLIEDETEVLIEARKNEDAMLRVEKEIDEEFEKQNLTEGEWALTNEEKEQIEQKKTKSHSNTIKRIHIPAPDEAYIRFPSQLPHRRIGSPEWKEWVKTGKVGGSRQVPISANSTNGSSMVEDELSAISQAVNYEIPKPHIPIAHSDLTNILELNMLLMDALLDGGIMSNEQKTTLTTELRKALIQKALRAMTRTGEISEDRSMPEVSNIQ